MKGRVDLHLVCTKYGVQSTEYSEQRRGMRVLLYGELWTEDSGVLRPHGRNLHAHCTESQRLHSSTGKPTYDMAVINECYLHHNYYDYIPLPIFPRIHPFHSVQSRPVHKSRPYSVHLLSFSHTHSLSSSFPPQSRKHYEESKTTTTHKRGTPCIPCTPFLRSPRSSFLVQVQTLHDPRIKEPLRQGLPQRALGN